MSRRALAIFFAVLIAFPALGARRPGDPLRPGWNLFSRQQDVQLGQEAAQQILKHASVVDDKSIQDYVARVGARLASQPEAAASGFTFHFTVLNDPQVNAFALPGGPMFIYTGLLKVLDNEAQLAGVMGHEMGHVILRHGTNQASKQAFLSIPAALATEATDDSMLGRLAKIGIDFGANSYLLHFSRNDENEADALGSHLMAEAGYNPLELARFFEKLQGPAAAQPQLFSLLNDHPDPGNRRVSIAAEVATLPARAYGYQTGEFTKVKPLVAKLPPPPKPALPEVDPSPEYRVVEAGSFQLQAPVEWAEHTIQNGLALAPEGGIVEHSITLGATLTFAHATGDLARDTAELTTQLTRDNASLHTTREARPTDLAGKPALTTELGAATEVDTLITCETPRGLFYAVFIAPSNQSGRAQPIFARMQRTLRFAP